MEVGNGDDADGSTSSKSNRKESSEGKQLNGLSNGYPEKHKNHKSEHKDKHRDKDKHRSKDHKSSSKDKEKYSSSSSKDKDRHSSHKSSKDKDKDRERDREKDKEKHKDKYKDEKKSSSSSKDKEHKTSKDKEYKSSKGEKRDKHAEKDRDKDRHVSSKDKDRHSGSKDKHHDKERDRHKEKHNSSSKDKDKKEKRSEKDSLEKKVKVEEKLEVESFIEDDSLDEDEPKLVIKEETPSQSDEVDANVSAASSCDYSLSQFKDEPKFEDEEQQRESSDEDVPLAARIDTASKKRKIKSEDEDNEDDDVPLAARKKPKKEKKAKTSKENKKDKKRKISDNEEEEEFKTVKKEKKNKIKEENDTSTPSPKKGRKKKEDEPQDVWKWWEEEKKDDGTKWTTLEHKGPVFAPPYERLPSNVKFCYDGKEMHLSEKAEEVAGFYAKMLDHDYTTKKIFNDNFFNDWKKVMTSKEKSTIVDLKKCNFKYMHAYFMDLAEKNRNKTKEEKLALKEKNEALLKEYGFCVIDGHKEKIGNFKIEPPGLFRGRGEHPKMGMLKRRVEAEDIIINCGKNSKIPQAPSGHKWKEVRHDPSVTWLASWTENVQNQVKYIMLNPSSKLKGEKDWQKYETARRLHKSIDKIRREYRDDWKSKEMRVRQRAVALYFIDKLALRAGNEKDEDQADTVGCCSLRVEHIELHEQRDDKEYVVVFDFLGKDSIRYYNEVPVEKRVFKNLQLFMESKAGADDLFDRLNTSILNKHLNELMEGLTAKVFRTYNASFTLQQQLDQLTNSDDSVSEKILSYNRANRAVAILCNHQRAVPKGHQKSMEKLKEKIDAKKDQIKDGERQVKDAQRDAKRGSVKEKQVYDKKKKMLQKLKEQLAKLEIQETDRDENKTIALGTSKLNYLDPRISVAWCKKYDVPIEKIYNKTQRDKFRWAIDMAGPDYRF